MAETADIRRLSSEKEKTFVFARQLPTIRQLIRPIDMEMGIVPALATGIQNAAVQEEATGS